MKREDMTAAAKFRVVCTTCGKRQPREATRWTAERWMAQHEAEHREGRP